MHPAAKMASHTIQPMKDCSVGISVDLKSVCNSTEAWWKMLQAFEKLRC